MGVVKSITMRGGDCEGNHKWGVVKVCTMGKVSGLHNVGVVNF